MSEERDETVFQPSTPIGTDTPAKRPADRAPTAPLQTDDAEEGTVFAASPASAPPLAVTPVPPVAPAAIPPVAQTPPPPSASDEEGTVFAAPAATPASTPPGAGPDAGIVQPFPPASPMTPPPVPTMSVARGGGASIGVGTVLNHMFEVKRFIARGGMGEVFEGVNIASGERVAIKTILPELAADPNVMAMFQKEALALTQLSHPAVVRYRGFALEPTLGFYYIAIGYIDGSNLSDLMGKSTLSEDELFSLTRRLAEGLREAHELGVVHRDISPDNVLLDGDRLDRPKIIDFGIVKDTDPGSKTIIGDGFAGKPSYVAPEQLGDFDKQVGPWSDVYSLALVALAMAQGRKPDLGGLPAEAIMKRRNGVDTSAIPPRLRPVIDRMLAPDPQARLRSMDEVIVALDAAQAGKPAKAAKARKPARPAKDTPGTPPASGKALPLLRSVPLPYLAGGGAALGIALLAGVGYLVAGGSGDAPSTPAPAAGSPATASLAQVDAAVQSALPAIPCSWITVETRQAEGFAAALTGVAGNPNDAENAIFQAARKLGVDVATETAGVDKIDPSYCPVLDELNKFRAGPPVRMTRSQPEYEIATIDPASGSSYAGQPGAQVVTDLSLGDIPGDFSIYSVEQGNNIGQAIGSRKMLQDYVASGKPDAQKLPGIENYRLSPYTNAKPGWAGLVLVTGNGGFTPTALSDLVSPAGKAAFEASAKANDWKVQMIWYKFVDNQPNDPTAPGVGQPSPNPAAAAN